jgi:hypothetical protein
MVAQDIVKPMTMTAGLLARFWPLLLLIGSIGYIANDLLLNAAVGAPSLSSGTVWSVGRVMAEQPDSSISISANDILGQGCAARASAAPLGDGMIIRPGFIALEPEQAFGVAVTETSRVPSLGTRSPSPFSS